MRKTNLHQVFQYLENKKAARLKERLFAFFPPCTVFSLPRLGLPGPGREDPSAAESAQRSEMPISTSPQLSIPSTW